MLLVLWLVAVAVLQETQLMESGVQQPPVPSQVALVRYDAAAVVVLAKTVLALAGSIVATAVRLLPTDSAKVAANPDMLASSVVVGPVNDPSTSSVGYAQLKAPCYAGAVASAEQVVPAAAGQIVLPPVAQVALASVEHFVLPPVEQVVAESVEQVVLSSVDQVMCPLLELVATVVPLV